MQTKVADRPAREFHREIADPDIFCGGGSVAALAAAGAASTALLVMRLNLRRRSNADRRSDILDAIATTEAAIDSFHDAADSDIAILDELLIAHRAARSGGSQEDYLVALARASESPIEMAEGILALLDTIATQLPISTRFTVSDLGAAAVLAEGASRAALMTAEVNVALLGEAADADQSVSQRLADRCTEVRALTIERAATIEEATRTAILTPPTAKDRR